MKTLFRNAVAAVALVAAGATVAACSTPTPPALSATKGGAPLPDGAKIPAAKPSGAAAADNSCDPTASYAPPASMPTPGGAMPSGSAMARIQKSGTLRVGVDQNTFGFGFYDPAQGKIVGFDISIAHAVARAIFGGDEANAERHTQLVAITSAQRIPYVQNGQVDIVVDTMTINCARWQQVNFSSVYYEAGQAILTLAGTKATSLADFANKKVCAAEGSTSIANMYSSGTKVVPVSVANWTDCLVMLQQHQVDAISTDDAILRGMGAQDPGTKLVTNADGSPYTFTAEPYGIAMKSKDNEFTSFVNGVLAELRAGGGAGWAALYHAAALPDPVPAVPAAKYLVSPRP